MGLPTQIVLVILVIVGIKHSLFALRDGASEQLSEYANANSGSQSYVVTSFGAPIDSLTSVITAGPRGPVVLQDVKFLEIMAHFNRERIPERPVHAKGAGAFGYFEVTKDLSEYTKACIFNEKGKRTRIAVRFSTVGGFSGSADTVRDPRGFAIKFYSECGNHDLVGNNTPVFFIRDTMLFFNFIHTQKVNPVTHLRDWDMYWDFFTLRPESMYQVLFMFSDRGIPDGFQHMDGFGSNTYKLVNASGQAVYCKFHFRTDQGLKYLTRQEAQVVAGVDPDYGIRKLYNAIHDGEYPSWTFYIQVMTFEQAEKSSFNPFDVTKIWPEDEYPLIQAGKLVLTENPKNYFSDVESFAADPGNMIEGIEPSPDKNLQGRLFAYTDAQRYRLGPNFMQLPINSPILNVTNYQRDGISNYYNQDGAPIYYPNSFHGPEVVPSAKMSAFPTSGDVDRYETRDDDNFSQPRVFYEQLSADERERLIDNLVDSIKNAASFIQERAVKNFMQVCDDLGQRISDGLAAAQ